MVPPCAVVIHRAMLSPRPHPSTVWLWLESPRKKGSKMRGRTSGGDARAGIGDGQLGRMARAAQAQGDGSFGRVVFDGVVGEVQQQLAQAVAVARNGQFLASVSG